MAQILIVDDDRKAAKTIEEHLNVAGHQCTLETSGARVIDVLKESNHDMVVLDIMLPGTSGFEVCRRIRRDPELYALPILVLSAMDDEEEVMHGLAQGADDYVVKPFNVVKLVQRIEALLRTCVNGSGIDCLTSLPGADGTKRELQRKVSHQMAFALAYVELAQLREYGWYYGAEARDKAIRHLGRALSQCGKGLDSKLFFVGHMGSGCFVCVLPPARAEAYCDHVRSVWEKHSEELTGVQVSRKGKRAGSKDQGPPQLDALFCITFREAKDTVTAHRMFEVLSQIRNKARAAHAGGIFVDRRTIGDGTAISSG